MNKGLTPLITIFVIAVFGIMSIPAITVLDNNEASSSPSPTSVPTPTTEPTVSPTEIPEPTPEETAAPPNTDTGSSNSVTIKSTSSSHIRTETNGVVHEVTIPGNDSYEYHDANTSIEVNN